jgi:hypothetical protein
MEPEGSAVHLPYKNLSIRMQKKRLKIVAKPFPSIIIFQKLNISAGHPRHFKCLRQIYMPAKNKICSEKISAIFTGRRLGRIRQHLLKRTVDEHILNASLLPGVSSFTRSVRRMGKAIQNPFRVVFGSIGS